MILIRGADVHEVGTRDVLIEGGLIAAVDHSISAENAVIVEAGGMNLGPGFVDIHCHTRDPGETWKEDIESVSRAGAAGGYTALVAMPNTVPATDNGTKARSIRRSGEEVGLLEVIPAGAVSTDRQGAGLADLDGMYHAGVRLFTDDGDCISSSSLMMAALDYLSDFEGAVLAQHAEDPELGREGHLHQGEQSLLYGVKGIPSLAEDLIVSRDIELAETLGGRIHFQHLSTARSVAKVAAAKERGVGVTAEVTPHHLVLSEQSLSELDTSLKMYPPLRTEKDRIGLVEGLRSGVIDAVATDHAPHSPAEKDVPFEVAARGIIGLETAFPLCLNALEGDIARLFEVMSTAPAEIAGLLGQGRPIAVGEPANLVLVDVSARWTVNEFVSRSENSPFRDADLQGKVVLTLFQGEITFDGRTHG